MPTISSERAMGGYYYLDGKMKFPFKARCRLARPISVLRAKEEVRVLGMAPEEESDTEMFVWVRRAGERIAVPLRQLQPCRKTMRPRKPSATVIGWIAATRCECTRTRIAKGLNRKREVSIAVIRRRTRGSVYRQRY